MVGVRAVLWVGQGRQQGCVGSQNQGGCVEGAGGKCGGTECGFKATLRCSRLHRWGKRPLHDKPLQDKKPPAQTPPLQVIAGCWRPSRQPPQSEHSDSFGLQAAKLTLSSTASAHQNGVVVACRTDRSRWSMSDVKPAACIIRPAGRR